MNSNFQMRLFTGSLLAILIIPIIYLPPYVYAIVTLIITLIALLEIFNVGRRALKLRIETFLIPIFLIISTFLTTFFYPVPFLILLLLTILMAFIWFVVDEKMELPAFMYLLFTIIYTGVANGVIIHIRKISPHYIFFLMLVVVLTDTGAYFVGRQFGKRKLAPILSPKKTVEGAIGGIVLGTVGALAFVSLLQFFPFLRFDTNISFSFVIYAIVLSIVSEFGDLFASKIKRHFGQKDFGSIFPGHGGVLDRVDGLIFASIIFYIILYIV